MPPIMRKLTFLETVALCPVRVCRRATFVHSAGGKCRALRQPVALGNALVVPCQSLGSGAARWAEEGVRVPLSAERARAAMGDKIWLANLGQEVKSRSHLRNCAIWNREVAQPEIAGSQMLTLLYPGT